MSKDIAIYMQRPLERRHANARDNRHGPKNIGPLYQIGIIHK